MQPAPKLLMCSTHTPNDTPKEPKNGWYTPPMHSTSKHARSQIVFCTQTPPICD